MGFASFEMLEKAFKRTEQPFRDMQCLTITVESRALPLLVTHVKSIPCLLISIEDGQIAPFPYLGSLENVKCFNLNFEEQREWPSNGFSMIKCLKNLLLLHITSSNHNTSLPALTDKEFGSAFENMSTLEGLTFDVQSNLSTAAIISLAVNCPNLRYCVMVGAYDLHNLQSIARPLFPGLWELTLTRLIEREPESRY